MSTTAGPHPSMRMRSPVARMRALPAPTLRSPAAPAESRAMLTARCPASREVTRAASAVLPPAALAMNSRPPALTPRRRAAIKDSSRALSGSNNTTSRSTPIWRACGERQRTGVLESMSRAIPGYCRRTVSRRENYPQGAEISATDRFVGDNHIPLPWGVAQLPRDPATPRRCRPHPRRGALVRPREAGPRERGQPRRSPASHRRCRSGAR